MTNQWTVYRMTPQVDLQQGTIIRDGAGNEVTNLVWSDVNADRIVAAVNFVEGYTNEELAELASLKQALLASRNEGIQDSLHVEEDNLYSAVEEMDKVIQTGDFDAVIKAFNVKFRRSNPDEGQAAQDSTDLEATPYGLLTSSQREERMQQYQDDDTDPDAGTFAEYDFKL